MNKKWKCVCGYIHDGDQAPGQCPKCGASAEKFTLFDDKAANLVERSRHTNALHCRLVNLARKIERVCKDGIEDNLDPACVESCPTLAMTFGDVDDPDSEVSRLIRSRKVHLNNPASGCDPQVYYLT